MQADNRAILGGLGNIDLYRSDQFPGHLRWQALALRLFEPAAGKWRIWWTSTASPGELDNPVIGRFAGGRGVFECRDELDGVHVDVRYEWLPTTPHPQWKQLFSFDSRRTWRENWIMDWLPARLER